ncbi:MAG: energy-coupled thiamine transporter ThiT [Clostridia bacterium]|nr:energy-coupled thiamine transporter ThiT [Clostridia bacterium]MBO5755875.1 energy-coupled thiamine transporter ThiT [Clostridia bacterium]MBO7169759.1 energy-coupled thiamine transporter ThiT [Clostridia bacterium]
MKRTKTHALVLCAMMVALSFVLSCAKLQEMPMGGSITVGSMLPIMLIAIAKGNKWGVSAAFVSSLFQLLQAVVAGNVFPYCETSFTLIVCVLFDYVVPFTVIGLAAVFRRLSFGKVRRGGIYLGITLVCFLRFLCHYLTGVVIWGQWAPDGMGKYLYSLLYNGEYMLPELAITLVLAVCLLESPEIQKIIGLSVDKAAEK